MAGFGIEAGHIEHLASSFKRRAECAANVFAEPARVNFVAQLRFVEFCHVITLRLFVMVRRFFFNRTITYFDTPVKHNYGKQSKNTNFFG